MTVVWVTRPGNEFPEDPELNRSIEEKQELFARINGDGDIECCRICGSTQNLSLEHTPSKAAYNKKSFLEFSVSHPLMQFLKWKARKVQGGSKSKTLCKLCNNNTGSWYNPEYVKLARTCSSLAKPRNANKIMSVRTCFSPSRVIRQALTNICSVSQLGLCKNYTHLKNYLLNRVQTIELQPLKVGLFINIANTGRSSGVTLFVDARRKIARLMAEFSFWPLGWILTFDDLPYSGTLDVTSWASYGIDEELELTLDIPCQWAVSPYPGDFRSPAEISN